MCSEVGLPLVFLLARTLVFFLSPRALVVARAWPCGRRSFGNEKEMRRECEGGGGGVVVEEPVVLKNQKEREEEVILVMSCVEDGNC